jgi:hypothetical protein
MESAKARYSENHPKGFDALNINQVAGYICAWKPVTFFSGAVAEYLNANDKR